MLLRTRQFAAFLIHCDGWIGDDSMRRQAGFFDVDDRLKRLSDLGDQLEAFEAAVEFEAFRPELNAALTYSDGTQGGRPPFDPVMMFKILVIQTTNNLSDERAEFLINDRLSFMRFLGFGLSDRVPDARTIWLFREKLTKAGAIGPLFERFDATLRQSGYIAMSGQIVDASLVAAPRQRNTQDEKKAIKDGRIPDGGENGSAVAVGGVVTARRPRATRERPTSHRALNLSLAPISKPRDFSNSSPVCEFRRGWLHFTCKPEPMAFPLDLTMVKLVW